MTGKAVECDDVKLKQMMLNECSILLNHFSSVHDERYLLFEVNVLKVDFHK